MADQVKENEVGGACGTHGEKRKKSTRFWWESLKEREPCKTKAQMGGGDQNGCWGDWLRRGGVVLKLILEK
jgi:hypothetical protein